MKEREIPRPPGEDSGTRISFEEFASRYPDAIGAIRELSGESADAEIASLRENATFTVSEAGWLSISISAPVTAGTV